MQCIDLKAIAKQAKAEKVKALSFREASRVIYESEGVRGFMRGLTPSLIKNSLMTGQYFSILFYSEQVLRRMRLFNDTQIQLLAGSFTKAMQSVLANPIIVIKTRLEVIGFNEYSGITDACRQIY